MTQVSQLPSLPLLEVSHVVKSYDGAKPALDDVSFSVRKGEFVSVIGPSGAGKSTLLRCINRMIEVSRGEVRFEGISVGQLNRKDLKRLRSKIGMIFQHYNLVDRLTVIENVLHGRLGSKSTLAGAMGRYSRDEKRQAMDVIAMLGLGDHVYQRCDRLSGGQKQRVGIGRALVQDPEDDSLRRTDCVAGSQRLAEHHGAAEEFLQADAHHPDRQPASGGVRSQVFGPHLGRQQRPARLRRPAG